ncbi:type I polyketide synthase [Nannocystis radixulma]|uniref:Beta-ketoacyl synthase N-terminal-like domain-containing protein n=1 Tax=Nannocystis radixulma TaxID=2995305 RepID=A0ABT5B0Y3_9BACT|nr:type I polyketide synthase [Nannocystis radixulma]MDC0667757.1 beta-ketoacyl synthase N-terminal-like domain-containing protein [Nannocystis radixulma]
MTASTDPMRQLLEQATRELRRLRAENERLAARGGPIAVVGIGCRFPGGADDPDAFWRLLEERVDAVREVPPGRWPLDPDAPRGARWAGLLDVPLSDFDGEFFSISPREAASLDPQQRLLLEVAWESLEDAGIAPARLAGTSGGVFVGLANLDYRERVDAAPPDVYAATGNLHSTAAGRLSYFLDLHGPSLAVDTACSSSLVAVHLAIRSLQRGECDLALAGGVQLLLSPRTTDKVATTLGLAPDGRCRAFDARAQGFVRAEGCGVVVLRRFADALRDGDPIRAVLRGSAVNHNGHTLGLTAPSPRAQELLLRAALADAGLAPEQIHCIEAMGAGSPLGDAIEIEALQAVYGAPRPDGTTCIVGSLKTNLGHMEAASGVAGLIKLVLALERETIPAQLHLDTPNPRLRLASSAVRLATSPEAWPRGHVPRYAGVSAFGIGGTNAHVLIEEAPVARISPTADHGRPVLLPLSARSPGALAALLARHRERLLASTRPSLPDLAHALAVARNHEPWRCALVGRTPADLLAAIDCVVLPIRPARDRPRLVFVCRDDLAPLDLAAFTDEPAFRDTLRACESVLARPLGPADLATTWAVQLALAAVFRSWGVEPDVLVGHGTGALAAAHLAGALDLAESARLVLAHISNAAAPITIPASPTNLPLHIIPSHDLRDRLAALAGDDVVVLVLGPDLALPFTCIPALADPCDPALALRRALAALYLAGHPVTWERPDPGRLRVRLPTYPWQRERAWIDPAPPSAPSPTPSAPLAADASPSPPRALDHHLRDLVWRPLAPLAAPITARTIALLGEHHDDITALARALTSLGADVTLHNLDDHRFAATDAIVVHLASTVAQMPASLATRLCHRLWALIRAVVQRGDRDPPRLVFLTRGAIDGTRLDHAPVWGLARSLAHEHSELRPRLVDLDPDQPIPLDLLARELLAPDDADQLALRLVDGAVQRLGARLVDADPTPRTTPASSRAFRLEQDRPGILAGLVLRAHPRSAPPAGSVEVAVEFAGLNFLDVLRALAALPADDVPLGAECVGRVVALGDGVDDLELGDRVIALADGALGTHVHVTRARLVRLPADLDPAAAATLPIASLTAWQALHHVARLQAGERVLIHAAAGGVGQAAVQIALARGAIVFATAGTETKRSMLRAQGVHHVASSRDRGFVDLVRAATDGEGVDVVLNSLAGDLLDASLELLRPDGRFIEIGKRDYHDDRRVGLAPFLRRLTWSLVDLRGLLPEPARIAPLLAEVTALWTTGALRPLPHRIVPIGDVGQAFAAMARGEHTGKLVLDLRHPADVAIAPARTPSLHDGLVLLTGHDLLTLRLAQWLADHGATRFALLADDLAAQDLDLALAPLRARARVDLLSPAPDLATALARLDLPLAAVLHPLAPARTASLVATTPEQQAELLAAGIDRAWELHRLAPDLLVFSTDVDATLGAAGHTAHAAAGAFLAALARQRDAQGRRTLCIEWGASGDAALALDDAVALFAELLARGAVHTTAMRFHPRRYRESHLAVARAPLLADLRDHADDRRLRSRLAAAPVDPRRDLLQTHLREQIAAVLRRPLDRLGLDDPLQQAGLDSLMTLELRNRLEASLDLALSPTVLWRHSTIRALTQHLLTHIADAPASDSPTSAARSESAAITSDDRSPSQTLLTTASRTDDLSSPASDASAPSQAADASASSQAADASASSQASDAPSTSRATDSPAPSRASDASASSQASDAPSTSRASDSSVPDEAAGIARFLADLAALAAAHPDPRNDR